MINVRIHIHVLIKCTCSLLFYFVTFSFLFIVLVVSGKKPAWCEIGRRWMTGKYEIITTSGGASKQTACCCVCWPVWVLSNGVSPYRLSESYLLPQPDESWLRFIPWSRVKMINREVTLYWQTARAILEENLINPMNSSYLTTTMHQHPRHRFEYDKCCLPLIYWIWNVSCIL